MTDHTRPHLLASALLSRTILLACLILAMANPAALASAVDTDHINAAIKEKGARWTAGETSVSDLSMEHKRRLASAPVPVAPSAESSVATAEAPAAQAAGAPAQFDLRNVNGRNFVTAVRDQGACGACWAFAVVGALESKALQFGAAQFDLAEQVLVSCDSRNQGCNGGELRSASDFARDNGLPLESCAPYRATDGSCGSVCPDWRSGAYRLSGYRAIQASVQSIKEALTTSGAVPCLMVAYDDLFSYKSGVYTHVAGGLIGGHAVVIIGYNDAGQFFIAKNSWGTQWGEAGFFNIAYSEMATSTAFGAGSLMYDGVLVPGPSFSMSPATLDFGPLVLPEATSRNLTVTLWNNGTVPLANFTLSCSDPHFSITPPTFPFLEVNASTAATVTYASAKAGPVNHSGNVSATSGSLSRSVVASGSTHTRPGTPTHVKPRDGETGVALTTTLTTSAFASGDGCSHEGSRWAIWDPNGTIIYMTSMKQGATTSDFDPGNKTSLKVPAGVLKPGQMYYWSVTYRDSYSVTSGASTPTVFTTGADPDPPDNSSPSSPSAGDSGGGGGGGCLIATAAFGTPLAPEVAALKQFRDTYLLTSPSGRWCVAFYYKHSPPAADFIAGSPVARALTRLVLSLLVWQIKHPFLSLAVFLLSLTGAAGLIARVRRKRRTARLTYSTRAAHR